MRRTKLNYVVAVMIVIVAIAAMMTQSENIASSIDSGQTEEDLADNFTRSDTYRDKIEENALEKSSDIVVPVSPVQPQETLGQPMDNSVGQADVMDDSTIETTKTEVDKSLSDSTDNILHNGSTEIVDGVVDEPIVEQPADGSDENQLGDEEAADDEQREPIADRGDSEDGHTNTDDTRLMGIDISRWQSQNHTIDWEEVKGDGIDFVFAKMSEGSTWMDPCANKHVEGAHRVGIPIGGYHFARPAHPIVEDAREEAANFVRCLQAAFGNENYGDLLAVVDVEAPYPKGAEGVSTADLLQWVEEFRQYFEQETDHTLMLYTGNWFIEVWDNFNYSSSGNPLTDMPLWIADYYVERKPAGGWTDWLVWQYTDEGSVDGIVGDVDMNVGPTGIEELTP